MDLHTAERRALLGTWQNWIVLLVAAVAARPSICGARYHREARAGPWVDASKFTYDDIYLRQKPAAPLGLPGPLAWNRTIGR
jgi:hypothetical protein